MNDTYSEIIVKRKTSNTTLLLRFVAIMTSVMIILLSMAALGMFGLMAGVFIVWLDIIIFRNTDIEYEYMFISGELDIDIIYGKRKRKRAKKFDMRKIEVMAPLNSDKLSSVNNNKSVKVMDYSSGYSDRKKYAFVINLDEGKVAKVIFEPSEKMIESIKYYMPSKVHTY